MSNGPRTVHLPAMVAFMALTGALGCATAQAPVAPSVEAAVSPPQAADPALAASNVRAPFQTGIASFYHPSLAGNKTASGERYEPGERTCAHPSLAFGTQVTVKLVRTGASAVCRVNDRGPCANARIIDLSKGMADALSVAGDDIHKVELYLAE